MKLPFILIFLFVIFNTCLAQYTDKKIDISFDKKYITQLSQGTLIVRLSQSEPSVEKIRALKGEKKAQQEIARIRKANIDLIKEFKTDYSFSEVVFSFDVDLYEYLQNPKLNIFLDDELQHDPTIKINQGPILILASQRNRIFQLHDRNLNLIGINAPEYSNRHFDRKYQYVYAQIAQSISNLFIKNISAYKFNKKLYAISTKTKSKNVALFLDTTSNDAITQAYPCGF